MTNLEGGLRRAMSTNEKVLALYSCESEFDAWDQDLESKRLIGLPVQPSQLMGVATGMGAYGMHPVIFLDQADLYSNSFLQLLNSSSQYRYQSGGQFTAPLTIVVRYKNALVLESLLAQVSGLQIYAPSNASDYERLLEKSAVEKDPVVIFAPEQWSLAAPEEEVEHLRARVLAEGSDITVITYGSMCALAVQAREAMLGEGASVEIIDLLSISPFSREALLASVQKTGRALILTESNRSFGVSAEIAAYIAESAVDSLLAPVKRVAAFDLPEAAAADSVTKPDLELLMASLKELKTY